MTRNRAAGIALLAGSAAGLVTMSLHPTGRDVAANAASGGHNVLAIGVHALAIAAIPVLLAGLLALTHRLARAREYVWAAFITYALASAAVMIAAVASGLIVPALAANAIGADETTRAVIQSQTHFAGEINQAFAKVFVMLSSAAIVLWSMAMHATTRGRTGFTRSLAWFGIIAASVLMLGVASGHLQLDIHGFGAVMLAQAIWLCWTGVVLMRLPDETNVPMA